MMTMSLSLSSLTIFLFNPSSRAGHWVPGTGGKTLAKHFVPPDATVKLDADKKVLLKFFRERQYEHPDGGEENELGEIKGGEKALLKAIDGESARGSS
jgi:hypothetical protein